MKQRLFLLIGFILSLSFPACTSDLESPKDSPTFIITGNRQAGFSSSETHRNTTEDIQEFSPGTQISFYSRGGIEADNLTLTFNGTSWTGVPDEKWIPEQETVSVTAYHPLFTTELYSPDGRLTDICYLKQDFPKSNHIQLSFSHLFSQISFHLAAELNNQVTEVRFTPSISIASVEPYTATLEYGNQAATLCFQREEDLTYTFIVPPSDAMEIEIEIVCSNGKTYRTRLPETSFKSGIHYTCNLVYDDGTAGIKTAEDFIAFSYLINGKTYGNRSLDEFGSSVNGITVYQLKNDIAFSEEESQELLPIGTPLGDKYLFNDVFEGNGHELSGILLNKIYTYNGVFGYVGKTGIIRNLFLKDIIYDIGEETGGYAGILCGKNQGTIDNCHIRTCIIQKVHKEQQIGGLNGINTGIIINSSAESLSVATGVNIGGIAYSSSGNILNCYAASCKYSTQLQVGGICQSIYEKGTIANCYMYGEGQSNVYGIACRADASSHIRYCYYPAGCNSGSFPSGVKENVSFYRDSTSYKLPGVLNDWISTNGKAQYPDIQFTPWEAGEEIPALFITLSENKLNDNG